MQGRKNPRIPPTPSHRAQYETNMVREHHGVAAVHALQQVPQLLAVNLAVAARARWVKAGNGPMMAISSQLKPSSVLAGALVLTHRCRMP